MSQLHVVESPVDVTVREVTPFAFDFTNRLGQGESVSTATAAMVDVATGDDLAAAVGNPSVSSPTVTVSVDWTDADIAAGHSYQLAVTATIGTRKEDALLLCRCLAQ